MFIIKISCGPKTDPNHHIVWFPMEGEIVHEKSNYGPVEISITNLNELDATIDAINIEPQELQSYFDFRGLIGQSIPKGKNTILTNTILSNPKNLNFTNIKPSLTIVFKFNDGNNIKYTSKTEFSIQPFPDYNEILSVDFGNTSTAIVLCKSNLLNIFNSLGMHAINLDDPKGEENTQTTAIVFVNINNNELKQWKVGNSVKSFFEQNAATQNIIQFDKTSRSYLFTGIKKLLGKEDSKLSYYAYDNHNDTNALEINGTELNKYVLEEFIARTERHIDRHSGGLVGRVRGIKNDLKKIVATHPVNYTPNKQEALKNIWAGLNIPGVDIKYDEATSCAIYYLCKQIFGTNKIEKFWAELISVNEILPTPNQPNKDITNKLSSETRLFHMLVFDCGGGTIDIALLRVEIERKRFEKNKIVSDNFFEIRPCVIGLSGTSDFAGDNMTLETLKLIRFVLLKNIIKIMNDNNIELVPLKQDDIDPVIAKQFEAITELKSFLAIKGEDPFFAGDIEVHKLCREAIPTNYSKLKINYLPDKVATAKKLWNLFWNLAEDAKIRLSTNDSTVVNIPPMVLEPLTYQGQDKNQGQQKFESLVNFPDLLSVKITRNELDSLLMKNVTLAWEYAADLCTTLKEKGQKLNQIVLAGKGSLYPLIKDAIPNIFCKIKDMNDIFSYHPSKIHQNESDAKFACAKGSAIAKAIELTTNQSNINFPDETIVSFSKLSNQVLPFSFCTSKDTTVPTAVVLLKRGETIPQNGTLESNLPDGVLGMAGIINIYKKLKNSYSLNDGQSFEEYVKYERRSEKECPDGLKPEDLKYVLEINSDLVLKCKSFWVEEATGTRLHVKEDKPLFVTPGIQKDEFSPHSGNN